MLYNIDINKMNKLMSNNEDARQIIPQLLRNHRNTISTISHEIRNPLTLVSSALQVMEKTKSGAQRHSTLESGNG